MTLDEELAAIPVDHRQSTLFRAVLERRVCRFDYPSNDGVALRVVEPWRVGYERGHWYLTGFDLDRDDQRRFRLDRMSASVTLGEPDGFSGPEPKREDAGYRAWDDGSADPVLAVIRVDGEQARWASETLGEHTVAGHGEDGSIVFRVPVTSWPAFRSFLLSFLDHAELLEPVELRTELIAWLSEAAEEGPR
jgi:proteasome accessory factor B